MAGRNIRMNLSGLVAALLPVFFVLALGYAVQPILGPTAAGAVGPVALSINLVVPRAVVLLEVDAAKHQSRTVLGDAGRQLSGLAS